MKIGFVGLGNLGKPLAKLIQNNLSYKDELILVDQRKKIKFIENSDILFLCVKPNDIFEVLKDINQTTNKDRLIISFAAGVNLENFEKKLNYCYPIVRCMTNIVVSKIVYISNKHLEPELEQKMHSLLRGPQIVKVDDENQIDLSTVLIGSMPAFASYLSEPFIELGQQNGLTYEQSKDWYISTMKSTLEMLKETNSNDIIRKVCSPGGITEKGIRLLDEKNVKDDIKSSLEKSLFSISKLTKNKD